MSPLSNRLGELFSESNRQILDSLNIPVALADESKTLTWATTKFGKIVEGEILGRDILKIFNIDAHSLSSDEIYYEENLFWGVRIVALNNTEISGYVLYLEEKNYGSEKLAARVKTIKNFAHDLNNILTSILNSASLLNVSPGADPKTRELIGNIESNSQRAADIIQQVLSDSSARLSSKRKVDIKKLFAELNNSLGNIVKSSISIEFMLDDNLGYITANYSDIYRVFLNLCINASEAIKNKGLIRVRVSKIPRADINEPIAGNSENYIKVIVKDNGSGIKKKHIDKIFNSNFSTKNRSRESGLGLNIVKEIIHDHNGFIAVKSQWWIGTEFTVYLPVRELGAKVSQYGNKYKIVVADDEKSILELLTDLLDSYNHVVFKAENGEQVIKILKQNPDVDLLIIDRKMPAMDGLECIKKVRELNFKKPVILTSGSGSLNHSQIKDVYNIQKIMIKPYDFNDLLDEINLLLM